MRRRTDEHLPQQMYLSHGTYFFRPEIGPAVRLGSEIGEVLTNYATLVSKTCSATTLGDVIDRYRVEILPLKRSAHTRSDQTRQLGELRKVFGNMLLDRIKAKHCYLYYDTRRGLNGNPVPTTARRELSLLGHVFSKAIRWGVANSNPAGCLDFGPKPVRRVQVPTMKAGALKEHCNDHLSLAVDLAMFLVQKRRDLMETTPRAFKNRPGRQ